MIRLIVSRSGRSRRAVMLGVFVASVVAAVTSLGTHAQVSGMAYPPMLSRAEILGFVEAGRQKLNYIPGQVLVRFKSGMIGPDQQRALMALRSRPDVSSLKWIGKTAVLTDESQPDAHVLAAQLASQPEVLWAEPNYLSRPHSVPNDPGFSQRQWNFTKIDMPRAWNVSDGADSNVIVAVIDTGITTVNQTFAFKTWNGSAIVDVNVPFGINTDLSGSRHVAPKDFVFWDGPVLDMGRHGTHVSSTIGEDTNNGLLEAGIAFRTRIMPLKVCLDFWDLQFLMSAQGIPGQPSSDGGCSNAAIAEAINYAATHGANVANISLGGPGGSNAIRDALTNAAALGMFVAVSMGNEFDEGDPVEFPAFYARDIDGVMSVAATGPTDRHAFYSSSGNHCEIAAPGGDSSFGVAGEIFQSTILGSDLLGFFPRFDRYTEVAFQGTSMASPHIAGIAALLFSHGLHDPALIEGVLESTALDLGDPGRDRLFGFGRVQPRLALIGAAIKK